MPCPFPRRGEGGQEEGLLQGVCARGFGMEKTLAVRQGIKQVLYSKETVRVEFFFERWIDGNQPSEETPPAAALRAAASTDDSFRPQNEKPTPTIGMGSSSGLVSSKWCPKHIFLQTLGFEFPNISYHLLRL